MISSFAYLDKSNVFDAFFSGFLEGTAGRTTRTPVDSQKEPMENLHHELLKDSKKEPLQNSRNVLLEGLQMKIQENSPKELLKDTL